MQDTNMKKTMQTAKEVQKAKEKIKKQEETSVIPSIQGDTKIITLRKGTKFEYAMKLRFPGVDRASSLLDDVENPFGNTSRTAFMQEVISQGIIESPKIKSIDDFFNTHKGFLEAYNKIYSFLINGLDGDIIQETDTESGK